MIYVHIHCKYNKGQHPRFGSLWCLNLLSNRAWASSACPGLVWQTIQEPLTQDNYALQELNVHNAKMLSKTSNKAVKPYASPHNLIDISLEFILNWNFCEIRFKLRLLVLESSVKLSMVTVCASPAAISYVDPGCWYPFLSEWWA